MLRVLQFLLVLVFVRVLWGALRMILARPGPARQASGSSPGTAFRGEVVRCDRCSLHVPVERILHDGGGNYCSDACRAGGN